MCTSVFLFRGLRLKENFWEDLRGLYYSLLSSNNVSCGVVDCAYIGLIFGKMHVPLVEQLVSLKNGRARYYTKSAGMQNASWPIPGSLEPGSLKLKPRLLGYTPCTVPYNTSYLRLVMLSYVVYIILYCNDNWRVKDGVVHRSRQQSLAAKWLGLGVYS